MRQFRGKRYWLVGASEGLGRALAERLSAAGAEVILSARSTERLAEVAASLPGPSLVLPVDVADAASVRGAAAAAGQIDGVVFLAGLYWPMAAQDWNADQVETMCDVNFTGCARVIGAVRRGLETWGTHNGASRAFASVQSNVDAEAKIAAWLGVVASREPLCREMRDEWF